MSSNTIVFMPNQPSIVPVKKFSWHKVGFSVQVNTGQETTEKPIIQNLSGCIMAGEVVAIMGGSGAGKTTLLNTLAGRIGPGKLTGKYQLLFIQTKCLLVSNLMRNRRNIGRWV
jgi:ABC-type lipoprotein export system ATPase subunit